METHTSSLASKNSSWKKEEKGEVRRDELEEREELGWNEEQEEEDKGGPACNEEERRIDPR